jgi:hypothetical protein
MRRVGEVRRAQMKEGWGEKGERAAVGAFYGGPVARQRERQGGPRVGAARREGSREERGPEHGGGQLGWAASASAPGRRARAAVLLSDRRGWRGAGDAGVSG